MPVKMHSIKTLHGIGYHFVSNAGNPYVDSLKFDKLAMTLDISGDEFDQIVKGLETYRITQYAKRLKYEPGYQYGYRVMISQPLDKENPSIKGIPVDKVAFTVKLTSDKQFTIRVEWNPYKIPSAFIQYHMDILLPDGGYNRLIIDGKVSELHEAIDIHKAKFEDFLITYPGFSYSKTIKSKGAVTEYLGKQNGSKSFCIYDKTAEIGNTNANFYATPDNAGFNKEPVPKYPIMRIEGRYKFKNPKPNLSDLIDEQIFPDYFTKVKVFNHLPGAFEGQPKTVEEMVTRQFICNCNTLGLLQSLKNLTPEYRKKMFQLLNENKVNWWKPKTLKQRAREIDKILNPEPLPEKIIGHLEVMMGNLFPHGIYGGGKKGIKNKTA